MWNSLILCLFVTINTGEVQSKVVKASEATQEDVELLQPVVHFWEQLPVILFATKESKELQKVLGLTKAEIIDGKLASGTTFFTNPPADQIFFCPKQDPNKKCLIPKQFRESEILKCDDELIPVLERYSGEMPCGLNDTGVLLMFIYDICPGKMAYRYGRYYYHIYSLCYVETAAKVLFASYEISATNLLTEKLLIREQEITFPLLKESYNLIDQHYYADLQDKTQFPTYGLQTLVPIEDMPLGTMRRTTRYYANYALQLKDLMENWNEIRKRIRNHAIKMNNQILEIMTGVFDKPQSTTSTSILDNPTKSVWVTKITARIGNHKRGLAIVINNFIATGPTSTAQYIDKLCNKEDTSVQNLKQIFEKVNGEVRCCQVTKEIMNLFSETDQVSQSLELLRIDNINQETLE